ncbi:MAG TPA: hypothetical protein VN934_09080 [Candidatus Tumulicola sp.]|nr:hypothetical protein [Candidatus Tumulicola sp.]
MEIGIALMVSAAVAGAQIETTKTRVAIAAIAAPLYRKLEPPWVLLVALMRQRTWRPCSRTKMMTVQRHYDGRRASPYLAEG